MRRRLLDTKKKGGEDNMTNEHQKIISDVATLAGKNLAIYGSIKEICLGWSDGKYDTLIETYEYLESQKSNEINLFMEMLSYIVRVSK